MPLVAFSFLMLTAFAAFAIDVSRSFLAAKRLQFAADTAAVYAYSRCTDLDGSYTPATARNRIHDAVMEAGAEAWNRSPSGPDLGESDVTFDESDLLYKTNESDTGEMVLRVIARMDGNRSLTQYFMPAVFTANIMRGSDVPDDAKRVAMIRASEVIGQPASRIGGGPRRGDNKFGRSAAFPLIVSNQQFSKAASTGTVGAQYTVDLPTSSSSAPLSTQHLRGAFVNVARGAHFANYYGTNGGTAGYDQLLGVLDYFSTLASDVVRPQPIERGVKLGAFDPGASDFESRKPEIIQRLKRIPVGSTIIVPISNDDPNFSTSGNTIIGFARLRLVSMLNPAQTDIQIVVQLAESVAVRNVGCDSAHTTVPFVVNAPLSASVAPFQGRAFDAATFGISKRPVGLALAPVLSPTNIQLR